MKNIRIVPIDNRPVTYTLLCDITKCSGNLSLEMPERQYLGGLKKNADIEEILNWLELSSEASLIVLSLDTIAYGGLIPSRRSKETFDEIKNRLDRLKEILIQKKAKNKNLKIYAFSSIMRISNNNINEEEKEYWNIWGKKIFEYSYNLHKNKKPHAECEIPPDILEDYLETRKRNFEINKCYLQWAKEKILDYLIFSKDDTGKYGLNVIEAESLQKYIEKENINAKIKTGADEIPMGLLLRGVVEDTKIKIKIVYRNKNSIQKISRYEDITVQKCVTEQIRGGIKNAEIVEENEDIILYVNNFDEIQGELVFLDNINNSVQNLDFKKPYIIADINNANGADCKLVETLLNKNSYENLLSYSGYNTSANSIGSALAAGVISYLAKKRGAFCPLAHKKLLALRLLDDWAYQANIRKFVQKEKIYPDIMNKYKDKFKFFENKIKKFLNINFETEYTLPWNRSFETEIILNEVKNGN